MRGGVAIWMKIRECVVQGGKEDKKLKELRKTFLERSGAIDERIDIELYI